MIKKTLIYILIIILCLVVPSQLLGVDETNTVEIETILSDQSLYEALQELDE